MVYHGALSKGCQRCRQRKVRCDLRKPGCLKCEKVKTACPGYRNLNDVLFRDESARVIRKSRKGTIQSLNKYSERGRVHPSNAPLCNLPPAIVSPIEEVAAQFFFTHYTCDQPPLSFAHNAWLLEAYYGSQTNHGLRAAVEAAGMAAMSTAFCATEVEIRSKERYAQALATTNLALSDPAKMTADTTLMCVIVLGVFEFIALESQQDYQSWLTHIEGAATLLQLRGKGQFNHERGAQLFVQLRSQLFYACLQQKAPPPRAIYQISRMYDESAFGKIRMNRNPRPISEDCFRVLALQAAVCNGELVESRAILEAATEIDVSLAAWEATQLSCRRYDSMTTDRVSSEQYAKENFHVHGGGIINTQIWTNWRALRIRINQIRLRYGPHSQDVISLIRRLSADICMSAPSFRGSPRASTMIWPLTVVAQERSNTNEERHWAIQELRHIGTTLGVRQASVLANTISVSMSK